MRSRLRTRAWSLMGAATLVVTACTGSTNPSTTTATPTTAVSPTTSSTEDPRLRLALPLDPAVVSGELDNGLSYYVRENDSPGGRAELRLLVDAGSVQEDEDQAGMAHFLEHMMFNGTERFPRNDLIQVLEAFGPRFGPDINASTSFDETVYELSLTTDDEQLLELGFDVLREWATRATLTEGDVTEERGVILDEWRLRAQGFGARVNDQLQLLVLPGTPYEDHLPIGTAESIQGTTPELLQRYYSDWYRPERMAVVAVGDFDAAEIEALIVDKFSDIANAGERRSWEPEPIDPLDAPRVARYLDEEAASSSITVLWPVATRPIVTTGDLQHAVARTLGLEILADRLSDYALSQTGPLLSAALVDTAWARAFRVTGVDAQVRGDRASDALEHLLGEVERLRRHGVTDDEFERAVSRFSALSRQVHEQQESAQDVFFAGQIAAHHLAGGHLMSPDQRFKVESDLIARLSRAEVESALRSIVDGPPVVLAVGADEDQALIPDPAAILAAIEGMSGMTLQPRSPVDPGASQLMEVPGRAPIVSTTTHPRFEFTTLTFANGAVVYLWESPIASEAIFALVEGFGGTSLIELEDLPEARMAANIVGRSGVGDADIPTLQRFLAGRLVGVSPWISETRQGIEGNSATKDAETLFQLIHLTMSAPRFDPVAVEAVLDELRALDAARGELPDLLFEEALTDAYYGDDPRYFVAPSSEQIESFDVAAVERVYRSLFSDAGDFAFVFVGDFDIDEMTDLAARYIGTLPADPDEPGFVDNQPLPERSIQVRRVEAGVGQQGQVGLFFTNEHQPVLKDRLAARLVELVLGARLRERIREELSATYSISASIDLQRDPDPFAEASVVSSGDPAGLDRIVEEVVAEISRLQEVGPTEEQFSTALAQLRDELDLIDNRTLAAGLVTAHLYPDQPVDELAERLSLIDAMTRDDVRRMARIAFNLGQRIEVRQVPRP